MLNTATILSQETLIFKGIDAINKLGEMGLSYETLANAASNGHKMKKKKSKYAPPICKSISFWENTIIMLREQLVEKLGWSICDDYNLNRTISPRKDYSIVVSSGNANVGKNANPSTLNKKGQLSAAVVDVNNVVQLSLFPIQSSKTKKYNVERIPHWFLLYYNDGNKIWLELSLPRQIGKDGRISSWFQRIILEPVEITSNIDVEQKIKERKSEIEYNIDISKKQ